MKAKYTRAGIVAAWVKKNELRTFPNDQKKLGKFCIDKPIQTLTQ